MVTKVTFWQTWIPVLVALIGGAVTLASVILGNWRAMRDLENLKLLRETRVVGSNEDAVTKKQLDDAERDLATRVAERYRVYTPDQKVLLATWLSLAPLGLLTIICAAIAAAAIPGGIPTELTWIPLQLAPGAIFAGTLAGVGFVISDYVRLRKADPPAIQTSNLA